MKPNITESLQNFIKINPKIENVYFDTKGNHYFNVFKLPENKEDKDEKNWKIYGTGLFSHMQVIPGIFNVDQKKEAISKGDPSALIVITMTRDEILNAEFKKEGDTLVSKIHNSTNAEKKLMLEALGLDEETLDLLNELKKVKKEKEENI